MSEFDFTDALKLVLVSIFMLGTVQLHALIDESTQHSADRSERLMAERRANPAARQLGDAPDSFDDGENQLRRGPAFRT